MALTQSMPWAVARTGVSVAATLPSSATTPRTTSSASFTGKSSSATSSTVLLLTGYKLSCTGLSTTGAGRFTFDVVAVVKFSIPDAVTSPLPFMGPDITYPACLHVPQIRYVLLDCTPTKGVIYCENGCVMLACGQWVAVE